ncbi:FYVE and coiled-coil domain-containing protein 1 isoform X1 [Carassius gibelio]|uniref:FYVE and coiled-coil domain-containing protein 1 isoform X1 n=1 Tax=Carassius gibelio TaxID=101364 RepID=UPI002278931D|nr:FYVE and coiled-coil domain-containing protein 1 isoform X1 [Carassius gibelio]XP_052390141.1 FYVE and coiled-coil domain-containing protein 1 isoform X1 [Carassius gibelio]
MSTVGENQLQRIIRDLHEAVSELSKEHYDSGEPITDDSSSLHKFCYKLEYLLQFDQKERTTFLGSRKDYWDYFCDCLAKNKGANDGIRFVKSIPELKTSLGKGRAFIRYCLVHQRLADTLQQCLINYKTTCEWYYERSPFLKSHLNTDIINHLYELNEVQFDVASRGHDLDSDWPTFARKTVGSAISAAHVWKPPSRCSSVNSLVSSYSQQAQELLPGQNIGSSLLGDLGELGEFSCSASEDLRIELDQSELKQQELQEKIKQLTSEAADLRAVVKDQQELLAKGPNQEKEEEQQVVKAVRECTDRLHTTTQGLEALQNSERNLEAKLSIAENRNMELLSKLDGALNEKGQQASNYCDSALKIQELLTKLKEAEEERIECKRESEDRARLAERLARELKLQEEKLKEMEGKLDTCRVSADKELTTAMQQADELQMNINRLQGALSLKERETGNLRTQLQDVQRALEAKEGQLEEHKKRIEEELQHKSVLEEQLNGKMTELSSVNQKILQLENLNQRLTAESQCLQKQAKTLEEYKNQCTSLMEINGKLIQTVKRNEESGKELVQTKNALERELIATQASERQLRTRLELAGLTMENQNLEECIQNGQMNSEETEIEQLGEKSISRLEKFNESGKTTTSRHLQEDSESSRSDNGESTSRLALAEAQLQLNMKEVSRLQEEVKELRAQLLVSSEERMKIQALQEVTEASREDLQAQTEQLKSQVEQLNHRHVEELLRCREREDALVKERDMEALVQVDIQTNLTEMREELHELKKQNSTLALENGEPNEVLHSTNTETAELGVHVCMLTGQNQEAQLRREELSTKLPELQMEAQEEVETLSDMMEALRKDNLRLQEQLKQTDGLPEAMQKLQGRLEQVEEEAKSVQGTRQREVDTLRSQLSDEAAHHQNQVQSLNEQLDALRKRLDNEVEKVSSLDSKVLELESANSNYSQLIEKKDALIGDSEIIINQKEEQIKFLRVDLTRAEEELALAKQSCNELGVNLSRSAMEKQAIELKLSAEIDDLYRTKKNLEERLIELIRDKDALWQKSDALEFEQKQRTEEQTDRDVTYCLSCHNHFSWMLRKHSCRSCGRPFCYNCLSHDAGVHQGSSSVRCCKDCFGQRRPGHADLGSPVRSAQSPKSSPTRTSTPGVPGALKSPRPDDTAYDIITEEEVNCVQDSHTTVLPTERQQLSSSDITSTEDSDELIGSVQDAEICLLKSGEMMLSVPFSVEDLVQFGDKSRELFIRSSCYSLILITAAHPGPTISWVFSSEPKSIAFSVVFRENLDTPLEQAKVVIPLTRCNSHKETIQGQLKIRNPGEYTLIFDNSFSRFLSKKVLYKLNIEKPEVSSGSDCSS